MRGAIMPITFTETPDDATQNEIATGRSRVRDEVQVGLDKIVGDMTAAWIKAGKPDPADAPRKRFSVPTKDKSAFKSMIRRATTLHRVAPIWYKDVKSGDNTTVKFAIGPVPVTPAKATDTPAPAPAPAAAPAPAPVPAAPQDQRRGVLGRR